MNKYLSKIVGAVASLALVIGVGVGIESNKEVKSVDAAIGDTPSGTWAPIDSNSDIGTGIDYLIGYSYNDVTYYSTGLTSSSALQFTNNLGSAVIFQLFSATSDYYLKCKISTKTYYIYNSSSTSIARAEEGKDNVPTTSWSIAKLNGSESYSIISSVQSGDYGRYLARTSTSNIPAKAYAQASGGGANNLYPSVTLYKKTGDAPVVTKCTMTYNANGGTGTITDTNSPYDSGTVVTVKSSSGFTAPAGKEFSHWYTTSSGTGGMLYNPDDTFEIPANTTLYAQWRDQIITEGTTDTLNYAFTGLTDEDNGYTPWSGKTGASGAVYSGSSNAKVDYIQLKSGTPSGIVTTSSGGFAKSVSVTWGGTNTNGRSITIYGKHTAYSGPADLYGDDEAKGTSIGTISFITNAKSNAINLSGSYEFIGIKVSGAMYMTSINIVWQTVAASVIGNSSVDAGTEWSGSVQENGSGNAVSNVVYTFTPSDGAVISASNTTNGTFTASSAGTVTVSATKLGYVIASKAVTVNPVVTPTIILSVPSIEGFTGEDFSVTATYSNLTSAFAWESPSGTGSISGSVTASTGNSTTGTSTFSGTLTSAGTVTLATSGGGVLSAPSVAFTITESTVEVTGLPANKEIQNGTTFDLGALIEVTAIGSCTDAVSWTSSASGVATVNSLGVVTAVAPGSTVITVTPTSYPAGAVACNVTVVNKKALLARSISVGDLVFLGSSDTSTQYDGPSGTTQDAFGKYITFSGSPLIDNYALEVCEGSTEGKFAFRIVSGTYEDYYLGWSGSKNSLKVTTTLDANSSWTVSIDEDGNATITNVATPARQIWWNVDTPRFACYTDKTDDEHYNKVQLWKLITPDSYLDSATTTKTIHGHENYTDEVVTSVDSVYIKFGATIAREKWDAIKANWTISDYGVMLMKSADLAAGGYTSIEDAFNKGANSSVLKNINQRAGGAAYEDPYEGDNCIFTIRVNFPDNNTYYNDVIYAVPYVVVSGQYYFLDEVHTSIHELATNYYDTGYEHLSDAALSILKA